MLTDQNSAIRIERSGAVAEVVISRPERKNSLTGPAVVELRKAFSDLEQDADVTAILLRGDGGFFSSGLDLKEFNADPRPAWTGTFSDEWRGLHEQLYLLSKPLVCALESYAINAGAALALAADFTIAGETAFLQVGEVRQGRPAPMNLAWLALKHGDALARRVALEGRRIPGPELEQLGLVYRIVPADEVLQASRDFAAQLAEVPAAGLALTRRILRELNPAGGTESIFARAAAIANAAPATGPMASLKE